MIPFKNSEYDITEKIKLTVIDIEDLSSEIISILDENFVQICEGNSGTDLLIAKKAVQKLYKSKNEKIIRGLTAEFFIHLYLKLYGFKQECLFLNLEEGSIKKGFDGYYSKDNIEWLMESKSGLKGNSNISHSKKVLLAAKDLEDKVVGNVSNNPWRNAYSHANLYDVGTSEDIRKNIKSLSDDFFNGNFYSIDKFNIMPCSTIFLSGTWDGVNHEDIFKEIKKIENKLKGNKIHVFCVTHKSVDIFKTYILQGDS